MIIVIIHNKNQSIRKQACVLSFVCELSVLVGTTTGSKCRDDGFRFQHYDLVIRVLNTTRIACCQKSCNLLINSRHWLIFFITKQCSNILTRSYNPNCRLAFIFAFAHKSSCSFRPWLSTVMHEEADQGLCQQQSPANEAGLKTELKILGCFTHIHSSATQKSYTIQSCLLFLIYGM